MTPLFVSGFLEFHGIMAWSKGSRNATILSQRGPVLPVPILPEGVGAFGQFFISTQVFKAPFVDASYPFPCGFERVELVTHLGFRYPVSSEAPSSSQVQDTRFSSLEQGFESPWGHVQRHAAISIAACVVLLDVFPAFSNGLRRKSSGFSFHAC